MAIISFLHGSNSGELFAQIRCFVYGVPSSYARMGNFARTLCESLHRFVLNFAKHMCKICTDFARKFAKDVCKIYTGFVRNFAWT
jgi:hypothetical protein